MSTNATEEQISHISTVNFHLIKECNYSCKYCFAKFSDIKEDKLSLDDQKLLIHQIAKSRYFKKINFAGGEPTLSPHLKELIKYAKEKNLKTSVVTNGSIISKEWLCEVSSYLDILSLSIDSINEQTNLDIGRHTKQRVVSAKEWMEIASICHHKGINLKVNTVVSNYNKSETIYTIINDMKPFRWKVLQATSIKGQNDSYNQEENLTSFESFISVNSNKVDPSIKLITESSEIIKGSYIMIDYTGRFFDNTNDSYRYSTPILKVGVEKALGEINVDVDKFRKRGGFYKV